MEGVSLIPAHKQDPARKQCIEHHAHLLVFDGYFNLVMTSSLTVGLCAILKCFLLDTVRCVDVQRDTRASTIVVVAKMHLGPKSQAVVVVVSLRMELLKIWMRAQYEKHSERCSH